MKIILKSVLVTKIVMFVTSHIQYIILNYHVKARQLLFLLKQHYFQTTVRNDIRSEGLEKIQFGCLPYGIVTVKGQVTCITNEVMSSKHDCVFKVYFCLFDSPIRLANCKAYKQYCPLHRDDTCFYQILHSSQKSRRMSAYTKCHYKLCVKDKPASLKSLCVNKLHEK